MRRVGLWSGLFLCALSGLDAESLPELVTRYARPTLAEKAVSIAGNRASVGDEFSELLWISTRPENLTDGGFFGRYFWGTELPEVKK